MRTFWLAALAVLAFTVRAHAQVIYLPVQSQYGDQTHFDYGGSNPAVIQQAESPRDASGTWGRINGWAFASANLRTHREVACEPPRVYTDAIPGWNGHLFGYTADDARNAANAAMPRYFAKADVVKAAEAAHGAVLIVPATPAPPK